MTVSENLKYLLKQLTWEETGGNGLPVLTHDPGHCQQGHQQCGIPHSSLQHWITGHHTLTASWLAAYCGASVAGRYHAHPTAQMEGNPPQRQRWAAESVWGDMTVRLMHLCVISRSRYVVLTSSSMYREDGGSTFRRNVSNHQPGTDLDWTTRDTMCLSRNKHAKQLFILDWSVSTV